MGLARRAVLVALAVFLGGCGAKDFEPTGEVADVPDRFRWPSTKAASAYVVQVFAEDGSVLFESRRLEKAEMPVGDARRAKLREAGTFEWRVRIYDGDRIAGHSDRRNVRVVAAGH